MADIFISYSRRDSEQALSLAERLRSAGMNVWIDQHGIEAATSWSKEIVDAIESASAFIILLSHSSLASDNVVKELSIASESKRPILPIELEAITLSSEFKYQLAGLQRAQISDHDSILRALTRQGIGSSEAPRLQPAMPETGLLRIAVLPFEDQSPAHDNEWFSDGLTDELISTLGKLDQLFVVDSQSSRIYKGAKLQTRDIASQLGVRYIVRGAVRKAGDKIRIQATLIDTSSGTTLWDEKFNGTMDDIFEIQEKTAIDITQGLKLKLTKAEVAEIEYRGTDNSDAYEHYLRALGTQGLAYEDQLRVIELCKQAIALDPNYANAYGSMAVQYANIYRRHGHKSEILQLQKEATEKAVELAADTPTTYNALANLYINLGDQEKAIETAYKMVSIAPKRSRSHSVVGFMYQESGRVVEAAKHFEQALSIDPGSLNDHNNLMGCYYYAKDTESLKKAAIRSFPHYEQYLALHPDDQSTRCNYMISLECIAEHDLSTREAERLLVGTDVYGFTYYQIASVYGRQGKLDLAIENLKKAAEKRTLDFNELSNDAEWFGSLHALPNFEELVAELKDLMARSNG